MWFVLPVGLSEELSTHSTHSFQGFLMLFPIHSFASAWYSSLLIISVHTIFKKFFYSVVCIYVYSKDVNNVFSAAISLQKSVASLLT